MSTLIFFTKKSVLDNLKILRPLEECNFNKIELRCPKCKITQLYNNTELCGDKSIVCDFCSMDIPFKYDKTHSWNNELKTYVGQTVISRI